MKGLGPWFPFVWIQCPDNRLHYSSIFRISADFTISPNHILSMCPMKQMLLLVGYASELLHMKIQRVRATIFFGQKAEGITHFPLGFTQYLHSQIYLISIHVAFLCLEQHLSLFQKGFFGDLILSNNMFSCFGQSYFSLPQSFSPVPYHSIIFFFVQHVLLIYIKFLIVYTTYCLDHISFQANCPNLWNLKIVPNKILPFEHYIFIFNTTHFCHVQMC